ncbi:MAG: hypothetical protein KC478_08025, partial [Bacteriovoracaceae bacterium]|nr:hypothetical protein [Bacteriovoracaceae bacterium]
DNQFSDYRHTSSFSFTPSSSGPKREIASQRPGTKERTPSQVNDRQKKKAVIDNQVAYEKDIEIRSLKQRYKEQNKVQASYREPDFLSESGSSYYLLEDSYAVEAVEGMAPIPGAQLKNGHYIVKGDRAPVDSVRVVQNSQTGELAIFTGIVKVKLTDSSYVDDILDNFDCELDKSYEHINTFFFKFDSYDQTLEANRQLSDAAYVLRTEVDVLEYSREAR